MKEWSESQNELLISEWFKFFVMNVKELHEEYNKEFGYVKFNRYNKTQYSNWLEKKLIDAMSVIESMKGGGNESKSPEANKKVCQHCGSEKDNEHGLCLSCGKFPVWAKLKDDSKKEPYVLTHEKWCEQLHCDVCGAYGRYDFVYINKFANGEEWSCLNCRNNIMVDFEPEQI